MDAYLWYSIDIFFEQNILNLLIKLYQFGNCPSLKLYENRQFLIYYCRINYQFAKLLDKANSLSQN